MAIERREQIESLKLSYERCLESETFFEDFYDTFMEKNPLIKKMFEQANMNRQYQMLRESITKSIGFLEGDLMTKFYMEDLAKKHDKKHWNISPEFYAVWKQSLLENIKSHDPEYNPDLEKSWTELLDKICAFFIDYYQRS